MTTSSVSFGVRKSDSSALVFGWRDNLPGVLGFALLSGVVSAVVAAVALGFSGTGGEPFGWAWAALWAVALLTILVTARAVFALANFVAPAMGRSLERRRLRREDQRFLEHARLDPRIMSEIDSAIRRADWE
jgi:hypothetical protein